MDKKILVIDDEPNILKSLDLILSAEGYTVFKAKNLAEARTCIDKENILLYLVDVQLPDGDGIEFIPTIRKSFTNAVIIMISGNASIKMAINATRKAADDFLEKPLSKEKLLLTLNNFIKRVELEEKYVNLEKSLGESQLIGKSAAMKDIMNQVNKIAATKSKVLITGESGTGKEIVARLIHNKSDRRDKPYIKINCAAIPGDLIEAELFGAEKGAYTGSIEQRDGRFSQANGGTLFLDEIGDMSLNTQTKVLRVLQEGEFERVGGSQTIKTDVRIITATNKDLELMVKDGQFREDLYFRLHVVPIFLPPLRERKEDIPYLTEYFLHIFSRENNKPAIKINGEALKKLMEYKWPGNIRELKNVIERTVIMADDLLIKVSNLPREILTAQFDPSHAYLTKSSLKKVREQIESDYIKYCLESVNGNISQAAQVLDVDRTYLYKKLKKLGLSN